MAEIQKGFETNFAKLSKTDKDVVTFNAAQQGLTPEEYLIQRGGVDARGRYGDMFQAGRDLSAEEYDKALAAATAAGATGANVGKALNVAKGKKAYDYYISQGLSPAAAEIVSGYTSTGALRGGKLGNVSEQAATLYRLYQGGQFGKDVFDRLMSNLTGGQLTNIYGGGAGTKIIAEEMGLNKTVTSSTTNSDGSTTVTYSDGTSQNFPAGTPIPGGKTGLTAAQSKSSSAFEVFRGFLRQYGLEGLAADVEKYKLEGLSDNELLMRLRTESTAYRNRFKANEARTAKGLAALSEAEYINLEDQYQNIMRNYGLPDTYYARGEMGRQPGFEKFIAGDVSATELEDRIQTAHNRVLYAAPEVSQSLREFYPDITNGDILAYALDPEQALTNIKRKVTAAEIGAGARQAGLGAGVARAEELARYGVTGAQAREGFQAVAGVLPRASMLADIYAKQEVGPYTQTTAEQEVFGLAGAAEAQRKRQKLSALEQAQFAGSSGAAGGALSRERAGSI